MVLNVVIKVCLFFPLIAWQLIYNIEFRNIMNYRLLINLNNNNNNNNNNFFYIALKSNDCPKRCLITIVKICIVALLFCKFFMYVFNNMIKNLNTNNIFILWGWHWSARTDMLGTGRRAGAVMRMLPFCQCLLRFVLGFVLGFASYVGWVCWLYTLCCWNVSPYSFDGIWLDFV